MWDLIGHIVEHADWFGVALLISLAINVITLCFTWRIAKYTKKLSEEAAYRLIEKLQGDRIQEIELKLLSSRQEQFELEGTRSAEELNRLARDLRRVLGDVDFTKRISQGSSETLYQKEDGSIESPSLDRGDGASLEGSSVESYPERSMDLTVELGIELDENDQPVFALVQTPPESTIVEVWYATNRNETGSAVPNKFYGSERAEVGYGMAAVSIPPTHKMGRVERPKWWRLEIRENPDGHIILTSLTKYGRDSFFDVVKTTVDNAAGKRPAMVFIHGFNVSFADAARKTAQIAYDLFDISGEQPGRAELSVIPFLFSWPSKGEAALYTHDISNADVSAKPLQQFLQDLKHKAGADEIIVMAHSMGNRALAAALNEIGSAMQCGNVPLIREVILAAPDVDRDLFKNISEGVFKAGKRVTLYASDRDKALCASRAINGHSRLGDLQGGIATFPNVDSIDATTVGEDIFAHGYYSGPTVLGDIFSLILKGDGPANRFGLAKRGSPPNHHWQFKARDAG